MAYFEMTSSTEEDDFYLPEEVEFEAVDELEPRSPHRGRRRKPTSRARRVRTGRKSRPRPRPRIRRPGNGTI